MNTDKLVGLLSTNLEPVNHNRLAVSLTLGLVLGGLCALVLMLMTVGPRPHFTSIGHLEWFMVKLLFALSVICVGTRPLLNSMRPGLERDTNYWPILYLVVAAIIVGLVTLLFGYLELSGQMLLGATATSPLRCLACVGIFASIPFVLMILVLREGAPIRLRLSGALAGTVAGGIGAAAYAFACVSDTIPFIAIWYSAAIALYAVIGATLGPWLLRW